jgi:ABC-type transport system involved in cytochrome bd biosynthesis fused ATPase/permease subunit
MLIWVLIILVMGILLLFGSGFVVSNSLVQPIGIIITLICVGIGIRMSALRRRGDREKLTVKIKELEDKIKELTEGKEQK